MKDGDRNTSFFHAKATTCSTANQVTSLLDRNVVLCDTREVMEAIVSDYFGDLFSSTFSHESAIDDTLRAI